MRNLISRRKLLNDCFKFNHIPLPVVSSVVDESLLDSDELENSVVELVSSLVLSDAADELDGDDDDESSVLEDSDSVVSWLLLDTLLLLLSNSVDIIYH